MASELSLKTPSTGLVTLSPADTVTDKTITLPATTGTMVVSTTDLAYSPYTGFRNRIINGGMVIDQRNAGAAVTPTDGQYTLDRWRSLQAVASKYSVQQSSTVPAGFGKSLLVTSLSAYTVGSSEYFVVEQLVEGFNFYDLAWGTANAQPVTLSFWVRSSLTGTFGGAFRNSAANRSYPFTYTISVANTWEYKTITVAGDTTGTWIGATNGIGVEVKFGLGVGSTLSGTAGAWAAANYLSATGATSVVGTNGATFYITGVQLEKGSTATPFEFRSIGQELALCQRYFQKINGSGNLRIVGQMYSTTSGRVMYYAYVPFRASPTITTSGLTGEAIGTGLITFGSIGGLVLGIDSVSFDLLSSGVAVGTYQQLTYSGVLSVSAEL